MTERADSLKADVRKVLKAFDEEVFVRNTERVGGVSARALVRPLMALARLREWADENRNPTDEKED